MASKYTDVNAIIQVIGCLFNNPYLLDANDKYALSTEDFPDAFHKIVFGSLYKIHELGAKEITLLSIDDFLKSRPKSKGTFDQHKGDEWLTKAAEVSSLSTFDYYYGRLKKMTLLRAFDDIGVNVNDIYDPDNILDAKKLQEQEEQLDNMTLLDIADKISGKVDNIRLQYVDQTYGKSYQAGDGLRDLIEELKITPEYGVPLYGSLMNTVTRGARLKKFYLRSAASGYGKTRTMAADACYIACGEIYYDNVGWTKVNTPQPTVFITTELTIDEMQTMMVAFLSHVDEGHILNGKYEDDEEERVQYAIELLEKAPLYIEELMDFSMQDIENIIKKNIREHDILYCFLDYIHSSIKILEEIATKTKGMKLREDNVLFMISNKMKNLCNEYGIFIMSATQLSGDWRDSDTPDQNLLRGSKAIADKIDWGAHLLPVSAKDKECLSSVVEAGHYGEPTMKISIYKNRRGKYKGIYLWCQTDLATCRVDPMFATTWDYSYTPIENIIISAF